MVKKKIIELYQKINFIKQKLYDTDYQAIKYAEGALSFEEYADMLKQRREWRNEINALETMISKLQNG